MHEPSEAAVKAAWKSLDENGWVGDDPVYELDVIRRALIAAAAAETAPATPPAGTVPVLAGVGRDEDGKLMVYGGANMTRDEIVDWFASCDYYDPHVYLTAMVPPEPVAPEVAATVEKPDA